MKKLFLLKTYISTFWKEYRNSKEDDGFNDGLFAFLFGICLFSITTGILLACTESELIFNKDREYYQQIDISYVGEKEEVLSLEIFSNSYLSKPLKEGNYDFRDNYIAEKFKYVKEARTSWMDEYYYLILEDIDFDLDLIKSHNYFEVKSIKIKNIDGFSNDGNKKKIDVMVEKGFDRLHTQKGLYALIFLLCLSGFVSLLLMFLKWTSSDRTKFSLEKAERETSIEKYNKEQEKIIEKYNKDFKDLI